jgi:hypothetical protein
MAPSTWSLDAPSVLIARVSIKPSWSPHVGSQPRSKTWMTIIRPPQQGQDKTRGSSGAAAFSC